MAFNIDILLPSPSSLLGLNFCDDLAAFKRALWLDLQYIEDDEELCAYDTDSHLPDEIFLFAIYCPDFRAHLCANDSDLLDDPHTPQYSARKRFADTCALLWNNIRGEVGFWESADLDFFCLQL